MRPLWLVAWLCALAAPASAGECANLARFQGRPEVARQYCQLRAAVTAYLESSVAGRGVGETPLEDRLRARWPLGLAALDPQNALDKLILEVLRDDRRGREDKAADLGLRADKAALEDLQRRYARVALEGQRFGIRDATDLARGYDNGRGDLDPKTGTAVLASASSARPALAASEKRGLKTGAVPLETFAALTDGIAVEGADPQNRALLAAALKHIYDIPTGRRVLRDLQAMRVEAQTQLDEARAAARAKPPEKRDSMEALLALPPKPGARLTVTVAIDSAGILAAGESYSGILLDNDGAAKVLVRAAKPGVKDKNPTRSFDKLLVHELRHQADQFIFARDVGVQWHLGEDRAYAQEALAALEQKAVMDRKREPESDRVTFLLGASAAKIRRDPEGFTLSMISDPLYLWNVSPADLGDPELALRARLQRAYDILAAAAAPETGEYWKAAAKRIDVDGSLAETFNRAPANGGAMVDRRRAAAFVAAAAALPAARLWVKGLLKAKAEFASKPESFERWRRAEREFYADMAAVRR